MHVFQLRYKKICLSVLFINQINPQDHWLTVRTPFPSFMKVNHKQAGSKPHPARSTSSRLLSTLNQERSANKDRGCSIFFKPPIQFLPETSSADREKTREQRWSQEERWLLHSRDRDGDDQSHSPRGQGKGHLPPHRGLAPTGHGPRHGSWTASASPQHKAALLGTRGQESRAAPGPAPDRSPDGGEGRYGHCSTGARGGLCPRSSQRTTCSRGALGCKGDLHQGLPLLLPVRDSKAWLTQRQLALLI